MTVYIMDAFETFKKYLAIKLHFSGKNYDYFKYHGSLKSANRNSFETRKDKYFFHKLSKHDNLEIFLATSFMLKNDVWVGDLFDEKYEKSYERTLKRIQSLEYTFKSELQQYDSLNDALNISTNSLPNILKDYKNNTISNETLIILNDCLNVFDYWSTNMPNDIWWEITKNNLCKYKGFINYDKSKYNKLLFTLFD